MTQAIFSVRNGMAKKAVTKTFNVPKITLLDKLAGHVQEEETQPDHISLLLKKKHR